MTRPAPFDVDEDEFIAGSGEPDVDDVFAKDFGRVMDDMRRFSPEDLVPDPDTPPVPSLAVPGVTIVTVPCGVLAMDQDGTPVGGYLSCDLSVDVAWQDQGLGRELVIERCLRDGVNPVLHLDEAAYSRAGIAAHRAAYRHARAERVETATRVARLRNAA